MIPRHVLWETFKTFVLTLVVSTLFLTLCGGVAEGVRKGFPPTVVLQLLPFVLPEMLRVTLPTCLLFAVCSTFAELSSANHLTALKSMGISPARLIWPVAVAAIALSFVTFGLYEACAAWARPNLNRTIAQSLEDIAYGVLRSEKHYESESCSIFVQQVDGRRLIRPVFVFPTEDKSQQITLTAAEARLNAHEQEHGDWAIRLTCRDGSIEVGDQGRLDFADTFTQDVRINTGSPNENHLTPAALPSDRLRVQLAHEKHELSRCSRQLQHLAPQASERQALANEMQHRRERLLRIQVEQPRRAANGLSCLCFAMFGIPIAMRMKTSDNMTVFFVSFLPILLVFYPLMILSETLARRDWFAPHSIWLADAVLLAIGGWMLHRALRR